MSRYAIPARDPRYDVVIGVDGPMETFFAQVSDRDGHEDEDAVLLWLGGSPREVTTLASLCTRLSYYAAIPGAIRAQLATDWAIRKPPTRLQSEMLRLLTQHEGGYEWE